MLVFTAFVVVATCLVLLVTFLVSWDDPLESTNNPETDDAYADGEITPLSPRVAGYLDRLYVDDNQRVVAGQPIAALESDDYAATVRADEAAVGVARSQLDAIAARIAAAAFEVARNGHVVTSEAAARWRTGLERQRQAVLLPSAVGLQRNLDDATAAARASAAATRVAEARTEESRRAVTVLEADRLAARAQVDVTEAALELARIDLGYTVIRAPRDGVVGARMVRVGSLVSPGTPVVILTPLADVWVDANFTERQITHIVVGQKARVRFDAFPDVTIAGTVVGVAPLTGQQQSPLMPDNTTGNYTKVVQHVPVKIGLDDQAGVLHGRVRPGMSAVVRVVTDPSAPILPGVVPAR